MICKLFPAYSCSYKQSFLIDTLQGCEYSKKYIIYNKPTRCNSVGIVFIKNYKYALHVSDALCVHLQEHCKL